jgi:glycolate oxidase
MTARLLERLAGSGVRWTADPSIVDSRRTDRSGWQPAGRPLAVVFPESVPEVRRTLRVADELRVPVVPRGAGTGLAGGAGAGAGSLVLDLTGMNRILDISPDDGLAVVQPGVITADLDRAAARYGLRYAPDPASVAISTVGGNIATNAGGLRCAKYGVTADAVLGLDVVLADGRLLHTGRRTVKGVAGYDLTRLFVGSEGTLGVVVGATVRLLPLPDATATVAASFASVADAAAGAAAVLAARIRPAMAELLDGPTLRAIDPARTDGALLLVQTDGAGAAAEASTVEDVLARHGATVAVTTDPAEAERLLAVRRAALPALERLGRPLIEDIAVPRGRLAEATSAVQAIGERTGVPVYVVAHAADGNLHPLLVVDPAADTIPAPAWRAAEEIFQLALRLGGTMTGEHGVGVLKRAWLRRELGGANHDLQRDLKNLFDPHGILNPGKAI